MARRKRVGWAALAVVALACGGGEAPPPAGGEAPAEGPAESPPPAAVEQSTQLVREVYSFAGSGRDPFGSLVSSPGANLRPLPEDLRLLTITYDAAYPGRSVAVVRDTTTNQRYELRVDDEIGRMRVTEIRRTEVVFTVENFGVPEQVVLAMRRRGGQGGY